MSTKVPENRFDSYEYHTKDEAALFTEIEQMEDNSRWIPGITSKELRLEAIEGPIYAPEISQRTGIDHDLVYETASEGTKLLIGYGNKTYCVRDTARGTLCETAKLFGSALGRMHQSVLADTLNNGLYVARGTSLLLERYGKISALHSDASGGYQVMPISDLLRISKRELENRFGILDFKQAYNRHDHTYAVWDLPDAQSELIDVYQKALSGTGSSNHAINFMPAVRFLSSDAHEITDSGYIAHDNKTGYEVLDETEEGAIRRLQERIATTEPVIEAVPAPPRSITQGDIDAAIQAWNGDIKSKHTVVRHMSAHARDRETAAFLRNEFGGDLAAFPVSADGATHDVPWAKVQRRIFQLMEADRLYTQDEQDGLDDIDPIAIRETLAERGIVNGEVVDPVAFESNPFVKDLSRLYRNRTEADRLIDDFLPEHEVRLVSVGDSIDTAEGDDEFIFLRNWANEQYARDISKKRRLSNRVRGNAGEPLGPPPYGYIKDPDDPKRWIIDDEAAEVVRRIYALVMEGYGTAQIAAKLSSEHIPTPVFYLRQKGINRPNRSKQEREPYRWNSSTVHKILTLQEYCGDIINFKTYSKSFKSKTRIENDPENMVIFKDVHEPVIERELWERVQQKRKNSTVKQPVKKSEPNIFAGLLVCADVT